MKTDGVITLIKMISVMLFIVDPETPKLIRDVFHVEKERREALKERR